jgi:hypothetical protein
VHNVCDARQTEVHTAQPLVPGSSRLEVEIAVVKLRKYELPEMKCLYKCRSKALMAFYFVCSAAVEMCKFDDISLALRWLLRHIPLVSSFARDPDFRVLHPYAAWSEAAFLQWNVGKQRAAEVSTFVLVHTVPKHSCKVLLAVTSLVGDGAEQHWIRI